MQSLELTATVPATPAQVFAAWLHSKSHAAMTGAGAKCSAKVGGKFSAWDGYITGSNLELEPDRRIVQAWRTSEFADSDGDSRLEIDLAADGAGTRITLRHSAIPDGQAEQYRQGWADFYFVPMASYFAGGPTYFAGGKR